MICLLLCQRKPGQRLISQRGQQFIPVFRQPDLDGDVPAARQHHKILCHRLRNENRAVYLRVGIAQPVLLLLGDVVGRIPVM